MSASAAPEGSPPGGGLAAQAHSAPGVRESGFVTWQKRKRKAEEAALAESQGAKCARAGAASTPGQALDFRPTADSDFGTARPQAEAHSDSGGLPAACAPRCFAALLRSAPAHSAATAGTGSRPDSAASGDAFGWDRGAAARRGPGAALASAAAGSSDAELESDEPSAMLGAASEDAQGASPGGSSSFRAAPASAEGAGPGFGAGHEGSMVGPEAAGERVQDPGQCLVLVAEHSSMKGDLTSWFASGWCRHRTVLSGPGMFVKHAASVVTEVVLTKRQLERRQWSVRAAGTARPVYSCAMPAPLPGEDAFSCMRQVTSCLATR